MLLADLICVPIFLFLFPIYCEITFNALHFYHPKITSCINNKLQMTKLRKILDLAVTYFLSHLFAVFIHSVYFCRYTFL